MHGVNAVDINVFLFNVYKRFFLLFLSHFYVYYTFERFDTYVTLQNNKIKIKIREIHQFKKNLKIRRTKKHTGEDRRTDGQTRTRMRPRPHWRSRPADRLVRRRLERKCRESYTL